MNIFVLNQDWLVNEWRAAGHRVVTCGLGGHMDIVLPTAHVHIDRALQMAKEKFEPDVLVIHDNSGPVVLAGLEETNIPIIFYSVDTHHHHSLHKYLAHLFDHTFVAQKDYIPLFKEIGAEAEWLPLWASRHVDASPDKQHGAVFVGNLNPDLNPHRVWFFEEVNKITKVSTQIGRWWEIFPYSEIIVNQTVKGDLNFRVFEAMICGSMLLTENIQNGLHELFRDNTHLVTYMQGNPDDAAEKINYYLSNKNLAREIGAAGREEILKNHTPAIRAEIFLKAISEVKKQNQPVKFQAAMANYCDLAHRAEKIDTAVSARGYVSAMKCLDKAIELGEPVDTQLACYAVCTLLKYDHFLNSTVGRQMLFRLREAYKSEPIFQIAELRHHLNYGDLNNAKKLAGLISSNPEQDTFEKSEHIVRMILEGHSFGI